MGIDFTSFYIYRWRYYIGYGFIAIALIGLLLFAGLYTPGGISQQEITTVIKSESVTLTDIDSLAVTNLPYHLLQKASITLLGVTDFSIKLPSLIFGFITAVGLILLLRRWFRPNIAVLASIIAITTGQFLFIAQSGTPGILYVLWPVWLLFIGTLIAKRAKPLLLWKFLFFIIAALSLYTPLSIYALVALAAAALLHPHLRYIISQLSKIQLLGAALLGAVIVTPLAIGIWKDPSLGLMILGIPSQWTNIGTNFMLLIEQYFGFMIPSTTNLMTPVFGLGSMLIIGFGMFKLVQTRDSTQSYLILIWLGCLLPVLLINPQFTSVTFLPLVLLLATGLSSLLGYWYSLFPRNPYARIAGLIPLIILVSVLILSGLERYVYGYHYDPLTVPNFSQDLKLLPADTQTLFVGPDELAFYRIVDIHDDALTVVSSVPTVDTFTATTAAHWMPSGYQISEIITSPNSDNAARFYIYKKVTN